jgi:AcrR family transcriptional regulator
MTDRRIRRTRRGLHEALITLILERGYDRVTVQDILDRADIGRSTFYAHFRDKDALLLASFDGLREDLGQLLDGTRPDLAQPPAALFAHAYQFRQVYRALCGRQAAGTVVFRYLHDTIGAVLREHLRPHLAEAGSAVPADLVVEFYVSSLLGVLTWWVANDFPGTPEGLAEAYGRLSVPGILAALDPAALDPAGRTAVTRAAASP